MSSLIIVDGNFASVVKRLLLEGAVVLDVNGERVEVVEVNASELMIEKTPAYPKLERDTSWRGGSLKKGGKTRYKRT